MPTSHAFGTRLRCGRRTPRRRTCDLPSSLLLALHLRLDHVPDHGGDVRAAKLGHLADAGGRGDVDLSEIVTDHVDADKDQSALFQLRPKPGADLLVAGG